MIYAYPCQLTPDEDGGLVVTFPDVPEPITGGSDRAEALAMAEDALATALAGYVHEGTAHLQGGACRPAGRQRMRRAQVDQPGSSVPHESSAEGAPKSTT